MRNAGVLSASDRAWIRKDLHPRVSRVEKNTDLARKLWDAFRSLHRYRGTGVKTYEQLDVSLQNVWLVMAATARREIRGVEKRKIRTAVKKAPR